MTVSDELREVAAAVEGQLPLAQTDPSLIAQVGQAEQLLARSLRVIADGSDPDAVVELRDAVADYAERIAAAHAAVPLKATGV